MKTLQACYTLKKAFCLILNTYFSEKFQFNDNRNKTLIDEGESLFQIIWTLSRLVSKVTTLSEFFQSSSERHCDNVDVGITIRLSEAISIRTDFYKQ